MRRSLIVLAAVSALVAGTTTAASGGSGASGDGMSLRIEGLHHPAAIARDVNGIAHIEARGEHDLFFLNGWVHAEDRLFQMDLNRRQPSGTVAELLGASALPGDVQARTIGLRRAAERSLPVLSPSTRDALDAYAAGVNAWVEAHPDLTPEYATLGLEQFDPWTPLDSVVVGKAIAFGLSFDLDIDATIAYQNYLATGQALGFDGDALFREDTWRVEPFAKAATVPDATAAEAATSGPGPSLDELAQRTGTPRLPDATLELAKTWRAQLEDGGPMFGQRLYTERAPGSNEWGISGELSETGKPMLANDPHLSLGLPSTFYPIHLSAGPYDVAGSAFAGAPGVVLGHNKDVMWGATTNPMDVTDTYAEQVVVDAGSPTGLSTVFQGNREHVLAVPEAYRVNTLGGGVVAVPPSPQLPAQTLIVPRRNNGPIVAFTPPSGSTPGSALSVQYTGFSGTRELDAILAWNRAMDLDDFQAGLTYFDFGSQNWSYADKRGNLAYVTSAEMPLREDLQAGTVNGAPPWFIRNGQGGNEWLPATSEQPGRAVPYEILPPEEMPHVVNPEAGFFVNANNDPTGSTFDNDPLNQTRPGGGIFYLNPGYDGFRAVRITEMVRAAIEGGQKLSFDDLKAQQSDVTLVDAEVLVPHLVEAFERAAAPGADPALAALAADGGVSEAVGRLRSWDFTTPTGIAAGYDASDVDGRRSALTDGEIRASVAATIYAVWRGQVLANTIDGTLRRVGLGSVLPDADQAMASLRHLLDTFDDTQGVGASGLDFFAVQGVAAGEDRRDLLLLQALRQGLDLLAGPEFAPAFGGSTDQDDYRWGVLHRKEFRHVLGGPWTAPPAGGLEPAVEGLAGVSTDGGFGTVDASGHSARADGLNEFTFGGGPVRRFVGIAQPGRPYAETSLPGGTSGLRGSSHYADLLPMWLTNETYRQFLREPELRPTITAATVVRPG